MPAKHNTIGPDVDLNVEEVYLANGTRLTDEVAERMAEEALAKHPGRRGRPTITGGPEHTPRITVRVAPETRKALEMIAAKEGRRLTDVSRDALDDYARRHAG
jgi:hypothetical protein